MKHAIFLLLFVQLCIAGFAQNSNITYDPNKALQVHIGIGGYYNDYKNLNETLTSAGFDNVGKFAITNLLEADMRMKNLLLGIGGSMGASAKKNDDYNTWLMSFYGGLNIGYYVVNNKNFHLAPQAGIGIYSSFVKISDRNGYDNFNELLENGNTITMNQYTPALDLSLRFDFADFTKNKTVIKGFRMGYKLGLAKRGWGINETSNSTLDGSPQDRINQFYATATIGLTALKPNKMK